MKKLFKGMTITLAMLLAFSACGKAPKAQNETPAAEPQIESAEPQSEAAENESAPDAAESPRQDGERFEATILLEGMEETVAYEHVRSEAAGIEMDYEYEDLERVAVQDGERFVSRWDDPANPWNYLEVVRNTGNAELVSSAINATLSGEYDTTVEYRSLEGTGECIYIEASVIKGTNQMADKLQIVYVIPAADGCRIATEHLAAEAAEGFGRRFGFMLNTLTLLDK